MLKRRVEKLEQQMKQSNQSLILVQRDLQNGTVWVPSLEIEGTEEQVKRILDEQTKPGDTIVYMNIPRKKPLELDVSEIEYLD
ncbi:hypothetical protein [Bacillus sp. Marseille-Q3570]|uniref:hypothetical protein n=1 Tax=Bacillus sp. Marseille-Q3570 TaxID=2963522 RepID=UPI0021B802D0|nr:hypothetical protein [Bacillus sp. Marseille-Q3570]